MDGRSKVKELIIMKEKIEKEIKELHDVLSSHGNAGMNEPLVDQEGYPRNDVDVHQIRISRNKIACLQNDHKSLMKEIEEELHSLHSQNKPERMETETSTSKVNVIIQDAVEPFATINMVSPGSPADIAGLRVGDEIIRFGSVNKSNFQSLHSIAAVVSHSENKIVEITVKRGGMPTRLVLTPKKWQGRGLLGCNIIPSQ